MTRAAALVFLAGCLISPPVHFGAGKSAKESQRQFAQELSPADLTTEAKWKGEPRVAKIRVYADDDYRAQNVQWEHSFDEQLDSTNQVLVPLVGLRLEAEYKVWDHHVAGATLPDELAALEQLDPGTDAFTVIGLTSALSLVAADFEVIGYASVGGNHLVLRGYADVEERHALDRAFKDLSQDEREHLYEARRRHKTTTVLLHELGHNLGLPHVDTDGAIMSKTYSHRANAFSDGEREVMLKTIEARLHPEAVPETTAGPVALPQSARDQMKEAEQLAASRDFAGAASIVDALVEAYPAHAAVRILACKLELARRGAKDPKTVATCDRAAELATDVDVAIDLAAARLIAGDASGARATLVGAETKLAALDPAKAGPGWLALADYYRAINALTWAEAAVAKANAQDDHGILAWAAMTRARYGVPKGANVKPDDEGAAVAAVKDVLALVNAGKYADATKLAGAAEKRWPALPGLYAARCDLELRRQAVSAARQDCTRAGDHSSWALYLGAILDLQDASGTKRGIAKLRAAIAIDPDLGQAWRALGKALDRAKATAELDQLRKDYAARFGSPLP